MAIAFRGEAKFEVPGAEPITLKLTLGGLEWLEDQHDGLNNLSGKFATGQIRIADVASVIAVGLDSEKPEAQLDRAKELISVSGWNNALDAAIRIYSIGMRPRSGNGDAAAEIAPAADADDKSSGSSESASAS